MLELEGTWEEIVAHAAELAGRRVRVTVLDAAENGQESGAMSQAERFAAAIRELEHERDPELVARVKSIRGKFARPGGGLASEELHRERQVDKENEEQQVP